MIDMIRMKHIAPLCCLFLASPLFVLSAHAAGEGSAQASASTTTSASAVAPASAAARDSASQQLRPGETSLPNVIVENAINRMFESVRRENDAHGTVSVAKVSEMVEEIVMPIVDEEVMAQFVLGRTWTQMSEVQRKEFIQLFKDVMIYTYAGALSEFVYYKPNFFPFKHDSSAQRVTIRLEIARPEGPAVPMQFRLRQTREGWKVYDALVDGISLVANYRNLFADIVRTDGIEGMLQKMRADRDAAVQRRNESATVGGSAAPTKGPAASSAAPPKGTTDTSAAPAKKPGASTGN